MKTRLLLSLLFAVLALTAQGKATWITANDRQVNDTNTWIAFQKDVRLTRKPRHMVARIACDSKYWLWINGRLVVFEGELKRGPKPDATYYDEVDLAPALSKGNNRVSILVCHFGKSGFSHAASGKAGLIIDADNDAFDTDASWAARLHPAYGTAPGELPNGRLPESNIRFDARRDIDGWQTADARMKFGFAPAVTIGNWGDAPWGEMEPRPIPQWKDYGIKNATFKIKPGAERDTLTVRLPGNIQMTPVIDVTDNTGGHVIDLWTNHSHYAGTWNVRAQYVTRQGHQRYESLGWMNGEELWLFVPKGATVNSVGYRQTGYDTTFEGTFESDSPFWNKFWQKALNTLYVNMRDTYTDCPERERAQWWGDETTLTGEAFYTMSRSSDKLMRKGLYELLRWQRPDSTIHAPVPGNYKTELPSQMLAAISPYGIWNYYMNTGDAQVVRDLYPNIKKYLLVYKLEADGFVADRKDVGWKWGDWGNHIDKRMVFAAWYVIALDAAKDMARMQGLDADVALWQGLQDKVKAAYNSYWSGFAYRHPEYLDATDDRAQFLAVVAGIAGPEKWDKVMRVMKQNEFCSPYLETYALQAYFMMGHGAEGMQRTARRMKQMVDDDREPTLWEFWDAGKYNFTTGSGNHAWSAGAIIIIARDLLGVRPTKPGYAEFAIDPQYVTFQHARISFPTVRGTVATGFRRTADGLEMTVTVPKTSRCLCYIPATDIAKVSVDGKRLRETDVADKHNGKLGVWLEKGDHAITVKSDAKTKDKQEKS